MYKKSISLFVLSFIIGTALFAQSEWCGTDMLLKEHFKNNPGAELLFEKEATFTPSQMSAVEKSNTTYVIPLAIHVIHYEGDGNITKAQIESGIQQLNEDYAKENSDTSSVRSHFSNIIGNANIEFRLARLDPNGACTEGITRHSALTTYSPIDINAPKSVIQWDPDSYLNVWIVNSINSGTGSGQIGGFAQFPFPSAGSKSTYGLVVRNDEWGTMGTATTSSFGGRAVTHEIGHCLNLFHPFQDGCPNVSSGQDCTNSGDRVCDTPPQASSNNNSCNHSLNTCSSDNVGGNAQNPNPYTTDVPDQLENFMGYAIRCQVMFTEGQVMRMHTAINQYPVLQNLVKQSNLVQTGTDDNYSASPCLANVEVDGLQKFVCIDDSVSFSENNWGGTIQSYNWSFPGGQPSSSTDAEPKVSYAAAGTYDVVLEVTNASGSDTLTLSDFVIVSSETGYSAATYFETFEDDSKFDSDWTILKSSPRPNWELSYFAGKGGSSQSVWINNFNVNSEKRSGERDAIVSPAIDMTAFNNPTINFDVAYSRKASIDGDKLNVYASADCGGSWVRVFSGNPYFIAFDNGNRGSNFLPANDNEWEKINIPTSQIPNNFKSKTNVRFKLELENGGGNNMYIDNFTLNSALTGIKGYNKEAVSSFSVFPNPAKDNVIIKVDVSKDEDQASIYLTDMLGKRVANIYEGQMRNKVYTFDVDLSEYASGIYFVTVQTSNDRSTQKLIVR